MEVLTAEAMSVEELVEATGLDSSEILSELTILELDGNVVRENGRYSRPL
jgi:predicted Rossmann fold nucleotide-binding protein DprA/Smf involved in DNA uptake